MAEQIRVEIAERVADFIQNNATIPCLAAVVVGDDPASAVYIRNKRRACERVGIESQLHRLPDDATEEDLLALLAKLNKDGQVHGILVQLPLPKQIASASGSWVPSTRSRTSMRFTRRISAVWSKGVPRFLPCTPHGVQQLLLRNGVTIAGAHAVIVGRSDIVGKPLAIMLAQRADGGNATVTVCHSRTRDLAAGHSPGGYPGRRDWPGATWSPARWSSRGPRSSTSASIGPTRDWSEMSTLTVSARWPAASRPCRAASGR